MNNETMNNGIAGVDLDELIKIFRQYGVVLAYLFGSQAEETTHPMSDVDIAVLFPHELDSGERFQRQLHLIGDVCHVFRRNDVDVVVLNEAPPLLAFEVVKHGKVLYEDPATRPAVDFIAHTISRYADTHHFRRLAREYLFERIDQRRLERMAST